MTNCKHSGDPLSLKFWKIFKKSSDSRTCKMNWRIKCVC